MNSQEIPLFGVTTILRQRMGLVLGFAAGGALLAFVAASVLPGRYTAKAMVLIEAGSAQPIPGRIESQQPAVDETAILTEVTALGAHDLLAAARARLAHDPVFTTIPSAADRPDVGASAIGKWIADWQHRAHQAVLGELASLGLARTDASPIPPVPDMRTMERQLKVFQEIGSRVIAVTYTAPDPHVAAAVANTVANLYVEGRLKRARGEVDSALASVEAAIPRLAASLQEKEAAAVAYQVAHGYLGEARAGVIEQKLADLARQNAEAQASLAATRARLGNLLALSHGYRDWEAFLRTQDSAQLIELHHQLQALMQSRSGQAVVADRPVDLAPGQTIGTAPLIARLRDEITLAVAGLRNDVTVAQSRAQAISQQLASVQSASGDVTLQTLSDDASATRLRLQQMRQRRIALLDERDSLVPAARILSAAPVPERPSSPSAFLFIPPAGILAGIIGMFAAIARSRSDRSIRTEQEVMSLLAMRCAGVIPQMARSKKKRLHEVVMDQPLSPYSESIRTILASIEPGPRAKKMGRAIMVTSSLPGEGKTTLAVSLATYAASLGRRVLLLDLDFRNSAVAREVGVLEGADVAEVIAASDTRVLAVQSHDKLGFDYLPVRGNAIETLKLLEPKRLGAFIQKLRQEYDQIVIDTAPVLAVADTSLVVPYVDRVLFAVRWGSTSRDLVHSAMEIVRRGLRQSERARIDVAAVLTRVDLRRHARGAYGDRGEVLAAYYSSRDGP